MISPETKFSPHLKTMTEPLGISTRGRRVLEGGVNASEGAQAFCSLKIGHVGEHYRTPQWHDAEKTTDSAALPGLDLLPMQDWFPTSD